MKERELGPQILRDAEDVSDNLIAMIESLHTGEISLEEGTFFVMGVHLGLTIREDHVVFGSKMRKMMDSIDKKEKEGRKGLKQVSNHFAENTSIEEKPHDSIRNNF